MAIQARFLLLGFIFFALLASGAFTPSAASHFDDQAPLEFAAVPPPPEDAARSGLIVQPAIDTQGSEIESAATDEIIEPDPWAEAFAEAARLTAAPVAETNEYPVVLNAHVRRFLDRFTGSRRSVVETWLNRSGRYLGMIREILRRHGVPSDLAFTAMIESGFDPLAVSRAGAKGLWQFMAKTGRLYGLRVDQWVDERFDPEKSTVAAAAYLRDLHAQFGSWTLAQAAYNAGEAAVARAIRAAGSSDFWVLNRTKLLHPETQEFVPAIQAATLIGRNPERYGFETAGPDRSVYERVTVPSSTDLRRVATAAGVSIEALRALNPVLVRGVTPPGATWDLRVPSGTRGTVLAALAPRRPVAVARGGNPVRPGGETHVVRARETLGSIAKQYGISVDDVLRWNSLESQDRIHPGDRLRVAELR